MVKFVVKALKSLGRHIVIFVISILTIAFLIVADIFALFVYPFWAWQNPMKASNSNSLVQIINRKWLISVVNPGDNYSPNQLVHFFQCIMRPIDAAVIVLLNRCFLHCFPIRKSVYFIDESGYRLIDLSKKSQREYFNIVNFDRKVHLIKNNLLAPEILAELYEEHKNCFVSAGKLTDEQFEKLSYTMIKDFCNKCDLNLPKQTSLIAAAKKDPDNYGPILRAYILRKGLHPSAVAYFHEVVDLNDINTHLELQQVPKFLQFRQDLMVVKQTNADNNKSHSNAFSAFSKYLEQRAELSYYAQIEMSSWQYETFHKRGLKLQKEAVYRKLIRAGKGDDEARCAALIMKFGEVEDNPTAMNQIAGDERLSQMWLKHLTDDVK